MGEGLQEGAKLPENRKGRRASPFPLSPLHTWGVTLQGEQALVFALPS